MYYEEHPNELKAIMALKMEINYIKVCGDIINDLTIQMGKNNIYDKSL